jgi:hypothetical protein
VAFYLPSFLSGILLNKLVSKRGYKADENLLVNRDRGGNEVVRDSDLFVFRGRASRVELINGIFYHHLRHKDLLVAARNLQEAAPVICLKEKPMPRIWSDCALSIPAFSFVTSYSGMNSL